MDPLRQPLNERPSLSLFESNSTKRFDDVEIGPIQLEFVGCSSESDGDVFEDGSSEKLGILRDDGNLGAEEGGLEGGDGNGGDEDVVVEGGRVGEIVLSKEEGCDG